METTHTPAPVKSFHGHAIKASLWEMDYCFNRTYVDVLPGADVAYEFSQNLWWLDGLCSLDENGKRHEYTVSIFIGNLSGVLDQTEQVEWRIIASNARESAEGYLWMKRQVEIARVHVENNFFFN